MNELLTWVYLRIMVMMMATMRMNLRNGNRGLYITTAVITVML